MSEAKVFYRTVLAAQYLALGKSTLEKFRLTGGGPMYSKIGKTVLYKKTDLDAWMESHKVSSTSQSDALRRRVG